MIDNFYITIFCCLYFYWIIKTIYVKYNNQKESTKRILKYNNMFNFQCCFKNINEHYFLEYEDCNNIMKRKNL